MWARPMGNKHQAILIQPTYPWFNNWPMYDITITSDVWKILWKTLAKCYKYILFLYEQNLKNIYQLYFINKNLLL